ncbi:uncharacterized protein G2W53_018507 [Senna tora]|uniref:Uncharacterized protein n=1 Tax=Senna tora TaxID=362788 RepID=A0A834WNE9_9FABA|nr:uncharacterized protein G2W53_018507 [Senna tora]
MGFCRRWRDLSNNVGGETNEGLEGHELTNRSNLSIIHSAARGRVLGGRKTFERWNPRAAKGERYSLQGNVQTPVRCCVVEPRWRHSSTISVASVGGDVSIAVFARG